MKRLLSFILITAHALAQLPPPPGASGDGIWQREAVFGEAQTTDTCNAHQPGTGMYHNHASPQCLRLQLNDNIEAAYTARTGTIFREKSAPWVHSPILGWSFDGYPIYGPYGYSNPLNPASAVRRIRSGFRLRQMTERTLLPTWALTFHPGVPQNLAPNQYGPPVNAQFPLGRYIEDYEHVEGQVDGQGDLDVYNGRFTITPEYPNGTYAYFVTISDTGGPAFPNILNMQYFGALTGGQARTLPGGLSEFLNTEPSTIPQLRSWETQNAGQDARVISGFNPAAGPQNTWPFAPVPGARTSGGASSPVKADVQRIRYSDSMVYINAEGLASHPMGPWFDALQGGGNFSNYPSAQAYQFAIPRTPAEASVKSSSGLGARGVWVNGVAIFNPADGSSYSNARGTDVGGGLVSPTSVHVSSASQERGPVAPGALLTAYALFGSTLATSTAIAPAANWPTTLGGTTLSITDAAGITLPAVISYVSPSQINYRLPLGFSSGYATVRLVSDAGAVSGNLNITSVYPNLFQVGSGLAAGYVNRLSNGQSNGQSSTEPIVRAAGGEYESVAVNLGPPSDEVYLTIFGSGRGNGNNVTATIGGVSATVAFAGDQGTYSGLDQFNLIVPRSLAGRGKVNLVVTVDDRASNPVTISIQ
ncbi:MAG: YHYH protein [Acidobacteria bacterium]|nr:YHYH protein [Acidobacteriota bacterium]